MLELNSSAVIAEVTACCEAYEAALVANDIAALQRFFWDSPAAIRFGVAEQLYGAEEISAFRQNRVINFSDRRVQRLTVLALGTDVAVAMLEFSAVVRDQPKQGRQTQVWIRLPEAGWRVAAAHVSHASTAQTSTWSTYADASSAIVGLSIDPSHRPGVIRHLEAAGGIASPLLTFPVPASAEVAPVFTP